MAKENTKKTEGVKEVPNVEALMQHISQLQADNTFLKKKLTEAAEQLRIASMGEFFKRIDLLWNIVTLKGSAEVFGDDFYNMCIAEFREMMFPPQQEQPEPKKD